MWHTKLLLLVVIINILLQKKLVSNTGVYEVVLLEWKRQYEDKIEKSD